MSSHEPGGFCLVRSDFAGQPRWALVGRTALDHATDCIQTEELEDISIDRHELSALVETVMGALQHYGASLAYTPGGADWLHIQYVPVRRFVAEILRKLLALDGWEPFASTSGPLALAPYDGLVGLRSSSSREYLVYTVTWSGIAFLLGAAAPCNATRSARLRNRSPTRRKSTEPSPLPADLRRQDVVAMSWSSRHAATLTPVLVELEREGQRSLLLDFATDPAERCPAPPTAGIDLQSAPSDLFPLSGTAEGLHLPDDGKLVAVKGHSVQLARLVRLRTVRKRAGEVAARVRNGVPI